MFFYFSFFYFPLASFFFYYVFLWSHYFFCVLNAVEGRVNLRYNLIDSYALWKYCLGYVFLIVFRFFVFIFFFFFRGFYVFIDYFLYMLHYLIAREGFFFRLLLRYLFSM